MCFCQSSKAASFLSLPAVNTPSSATCLHTAVSGCSPMLGDFWDLSQGHCLYVLPNGSARPVNVQVNEAAVVLKFSDGLSEQDTGMRCCCRGKRPDESKVTKELKIPDLLGISTGRFKLNIFYSFFCFPNSGTGAVCFAFVSFCMQFWS